MPPISLEYQGNDDNALNVLAGLASLPVPDGGKNTENRIRILSDSAGVDLSDYSGSDRNLIDRLALLLGGYVLALSAAWAALFGKKEATVDGWNVSATGTGEIEIFIATSDPGHPVQWETGVRCIEVRPALDYQAGIYNRQAGFGSLGVDWVVTVRREGGSGTPGDTHWNVYRERISNAAIYDQLASVAGPSSDVATIGVDGATGDVLAWINGEPVALHTYASGLMPGGGVVLAVAINFQAAGLGLSSSVEVAAVAGDYQFPIAGAQDMNGAAL